MEVSDINFNTELTNNAKVIVKYYADWCGSCKLFAPTFRRLSNEERFAGISFLEVNSEQNPVARKSAGVNNLPFFAIFKEGKLLQGSATSKVETVVEMLEKL